MFLTLSAPLGRHIGSKLGAISLQLGLKCTRRTPERIERVVGWAKVERNGNQKDKKVSWRLPKVIEREPKVRQMEAKGSQRGAKESHETPKREPNGSRWATKCCQESINEYMQNLMPPKHDFSSIFQTDNVHDFSGLRMIFCDECCLSWEGRNSANLCIPAVERVPARIRPKRREPIIFGASIKKHAKVSHKKAMQELRKHSCHIYRNGANIGEISMQKSITSGNWRPESGKWKLERRKRRSESE